MKENNHKPQYKDLCIGNIRISARSLANTPHEYEHMRMIVARVGSEVNADSRLQPLQEDIVIEAYHTFRKAKVYAPDMDVALAQAVVGNTISSLLRAIRQPNLNSPIKVFADGRRAISLDTPVGKDDDESSSTLYDLIGDSIGGGGSSVESAYDYHAVQDVLARLDERDQEIIRMQVLGMDNTEIAEKLDISPSYVGRRAKKICKHVREALGC